MSDNARAARGQKKASERGKVVPFPRYHIVHIELTICELKQVPSANPDVEERTSEYLYSANTRNIGHVGADITKSKDLVIGWCEFKATKSVEDELRAEVTATYLFVYTYPDSPPAGEWGRDDITEFVVAASVWPRFRDLVAHMMAQGSTVFPPLPLAPDKIGHTPRRPIEAE